MLRLMMIIVLCSTACATCVVAAQTELPVIRESVSLPLTISDGRYTVVVTRDEASDRPVSAPFANWLRRAMRIRVTDSKEGAVHEFAYSAIEFAGSPLEISAVALASGRLVIASRLHVGVFDLSSGEQKLSAGDESIVKDAKVSPDGRFLSCKIVAPRFSNTVNSEVLVVVSLQSLAAREVFPTGLELTGPHAWFYQTLVDKGGASSGYVDHQLGSYFWSPDGRWLVAPCVHSREEKRTAESFLVFLRVGDDGSVVQRWHERVDAKDVALAATPGQGVALDIETISWVDDRTFIASPWKHSERLKPKMIFMLPKYVEPVSQ